MNIAAKSITDLMADDLAKSGITHTDMLTRILDEASRTALALSSNVKGYVIPYFNIHGGLTQYYRAKILEGGAPDVKYMQLPNTPNHIYFPKNFLKTFKAVEGSICIITEGEKKAALCNRMGIPCVGLGGVDSWRNRTLVLPKGVEITQRKNSTAVKLPVATVEDAKLQPYALGFQELIDLALQYNTTIIICYDLDTMHRTTTTVQRAAARLGFELRYKGMKMSQIRQLILPRGFEDREGKTSIEDVLLSSAGGPEGLMKLIQKVLLKRSAFPTHPNIREYIGRQLGKPRLERKEINNVALAVLTELDAKGTRMYSPDDYQMYYFDGKNNHLMKVDINTGANTLSRSQEAEFGMMLYKDFGLSLSADQRVIQWLGSQFAGEDPVERVSPHRIVAKPKPDEDIIRFQINNGQYIKVTGDTQKPFTIQPNGSDGVLFESQSNHVEGIDADKLRDEIQRQYKGPIQNKWLEVLKEVRLKYPDSRIAELISLLYYISPFLLRWRGTQLPVEIVVGEAGSGKSSLCEVRLRILTGDPKLRGTPENLKEWFAAIAAQGGINITDNVHMTDKNLKQRISDELCRLVTEPDPRINMRKYFTEADERTIRVTSTFGFTAIQQPFPNGDLLQRAVVLDLAKADSDLRATTFDNYWTDRQLEANGGRTGWIAHHMIVLHHFLRLANQKWDHNYKARNRLIGLEQSLRLMAQVFGMAHDWIPEFLSNQTYQGIQSADWVLQGLTEFSNYALDLQEKRRALNGRERSYVKEFTAGDIVDWAQTNEEYEDCFQLKNARALGRYLQANKANVVIVSGIVEHGIRGNRMIYRVKEGTKKNDGHH